MHIQCQSQQVNRRHIIKLTHTLTALEPARGYPQRLHFGGSGLTLSNCGKEGVRNKDPPCEERDVFHSKYVAS